MIFSKKNILFRFVIILLVVNCYVLTAQTITTSLDSNVRDKTNLDFGFNRRSDSGVWWTDSSFQNLLVEMNPDVLRYPGGTQANYWDWRTGQFLDNTDKSWSNKEIVKIPEFVAAIPSRTKIIYVINLARPTPSTGLSINASEAVLKSDVTLNLKITDMLQAISEFSTQGKLPYAIELGNEFYFGNEESGVFEIIESGGFFYSGWDEENNQPFKSLDKKDATVITAKFYLKQCKTIVSAIKTQYPDLKFALVSTKSGNGNSTRESWNNTIYDELANNSDYSILKDDIYALTQHHYLNDTYGDQTVIANTDQAKIAISEGIQYPIDVQADYDMVPNNYKIWYTEYGVTKPNADETWASAVRFAALVHSWIKRGDKVGQLDYHYVSDYNVVKTGSPMKLAPIGIAAKILAMATVDMTEMQEINFSNNPPSVNGINSFYGYKFKNAYKETLLLINIGDLNLSKIKFNNLISYTGEPKMTQYYSDSPFVSGVFDGHSNIVSNINNVSRTLIVPNFSLTVVEVENKTKLVDSVKSNPLLVYPNPVKDILTIKGDENIQSLIIWNSLGELIYQNDTPSNEEINLSSLKAGVYLLKISLEKGIEFKKIIKN